MPRVKVKAPRILNMQAPVRELGPYPFAGPAWGATEYNPVAHGNCRWVYVYADGSRMEVNANGGEEEYGARYVWEDVE